MKKTALFLGALLFAAGGVFSDEDVEHTKIRKLASPEFDISEVAETAMAGVFSQMAVWSERKGSGENVSYEGWVVRDGKKLLFSLFYEDKKLHGNFNGNEFSFLKLDAKGQKYVFKTGDGEAEVSYSYERKAGRHIINPLFVLDNNGRKYMVRLKGECCLGHGLYYAAVIYGLTTLDEPAAETGSEE